MHFVHVKSRVLEIKLTIVHLGNFASKNLPRYLFCQQKLSINLVLLIYLVESDVLKYGMVMEDGLMERGNHILAVSYSFC